MNTMSQPDLSGITPALGDVKARLRSELARANREKHTTPLKIQMRVAGIPAPIEEHRFAAEAVGWNVLESKANVKKGALRQLLDRKGYSDWRFDFCWPEHMIAMEIDGGGQRGRHMTNAGFKSDCAKLNEAQLLGWTVYRVTGDMVKSGKAINLLVRVFRAAGVQF